MPGQDISDFQKEPWRRTGLPLSKSEKAAYRARFHADETTKTVKQKKQEVKSFEASKSWYLRGGPASDAGRSHQLSRPATAASTTSRASDAYGGGNGGSGGGGGGDDYVVQFPGDDCVYRFKDWESTVRAFSERGFDPSVADVREKSGRNGEMMLLSGSIASGSLTERASSTRRSSMPTQHAHRYSVPGLVPPPHLHEMEPYMPKHHFRSTYDTFINGTSTLIAHGPASAAHPPNGVNSGGGAHPHGHHRETRRQKEERMATPRGLTSASGGKNLYTMLKYSGTTTLTAAHRLKKFDRPKTVPAKEPPKRLVIRDMPMTGKDYLFAPRVGDWRV